MLDLFQKEIKKNFFGLKTDKINILINKNFDTMIYCILSVSSCLFLCKL